MNKKVMELLKKARTIAKITQDQAAEEMGVKKNTISNYETGVCEPSIDNLIKMCQFYGADPCYIFSIAYDLPMKKDILSPECKNLTEIYNSLDNHGKSVIFSVAEAEYDRICTLSEDWKKYLNAPIAARTGGVTVATEDDAKQLAALASYLKDQGAL